MAVNLTNADSALKTYYIDAVKEQINTKVNPFLSSIKYTTNDVWGKEVKKTIITGINGGIGAGTEDGELPNASGNTYEAITLPLKNLYGSIEISDKAVRASENNAGAFVNLLNAEMEGLLKSGIFNFNRMLFGDGNGKLANVSSIDNGVMQVDGTQSLQEGMVVEIRTTDGEIINALGKRKIISIDRKQNVVVVEGTNCNYSNACCIYLQGSYQNEITGFSAIFDDSEKLYGLNRNEHGFLNPIKQTASSDFSLMELQELLDSIEQNTGTGANFIMCSLGVRRVLQKAFSENIRNIDTMVLSGGYTAMSYNGIPIVADRFCPSGTIYCLNTNDFAIHQLCDWQWLQDDDGRVLKQIPGKPVYSATLVKYAELICSNPSGQGVITNIAE